MKIQSHDEDGFPMNYDPTSFYQTKEEWYALPHEMFETLMLDYSF